MDNNELQYLSLFKDVCKKINSSLDFEEVLNKITENAVKALKVKACTVFLLDKEQERLKVSASFGLSESYLNKGPVEAKKSIEECLRGKWVLVLDTSNDLRIQYPEKAKAEGIASILAVPITVKENIIGVLRIYTSEPREFSDLEREFISGLAEIGGIGIENARMFDHLKDNYDLLIRDIHQYFEFGRRP
jgi:transcriptional regulator with GAF, ATPase, and Fis domain